MNVCMYVYVCMCVCMYVCVSLSLSLSLSLSVCMCNHKANEHLMAGAFLFNKLNQICAANEFSPDDTLCEEIPAAVKTTR